MDELRARIQLLIAERNELAAICVREHREFVDHELERLALLDASINSALNALKFLAPPEPQPSQVPVQINPDYRLVAKAYYDANRDGYKFVSQLVGDYGRWLVTTIAAAEFGGMVLIGNLEGIPWSSKEPALWSLVVGIVLIFSCGLVTYFNWSALAELYDKRNNVNMLVNPDAFPRDDPKLGGRIKFTYVSAIVLGALSVLSIPVAAGILSWLTP
ncbi:hypothetical protein [Devosia beringensis]|uniref:hypothetical protein n=1 Tax=Devosia beringensis TaxID=2657486 RepID=UPI00186B803E|nr:hypothetical protein [Devosia beringensis]